jgi:hypothetical protein
MWRPHNAAFISAVRDENALNNVQAIVAGTALPITVFRLPQP